MLHFTNFNYFISWAATVWCINLSVCEWMLTCAQLVCNFCVSRAKITHYLLNKCMNLSQSMAGFSSYTSMTVRSEGRKLKLITVNGVQTLFCASRSTHAATYCILRIIFIYEALFQRPNYKCCTGQTPLKIYKKNKTHKKRKQASFICSLIKEVSKVKQWFL